MSFTVTISGTPTTAYVGDVYTATVVINVPSSNTTVFTNTARLRFQVTSPQAIIEAVEKVDCSAFVSSTSYNGPSGNNLPAYVGTMYFTAMPANNTSFTLRFQCKVLQTGTMTPFAADVFAFASGLPMVYAEAATCVVSLPQGAVGTPSQITGLAAAAASVSQINLTWTDTNTNESGVVIYRSTDGAAYTEIARVATNAVSYSSVNLTAGTLYYFKVAAFNTLGLGAFSAVASASTTAAPVAPTGSATSPTATVVDDTTIDLAWVDGATGETEWIIARDTDSGGPYTELARVPTGILAYRDTTCAPNTNYYYTISPYNTGGTGTASSEVTAKTQRKAVSVAEQSGFSIDSRAKIRKIMVGGRLMVFNDYGRPLIYINRRWYLGGVKPQLTAPTCASTGSGSLTGTFTAYIVLTRKDGETRSVYGVVSTPAVTVTSKQLLITPPNGSGEVTIRDTGYDTNGTAIDGCDRWEVYLYEENLDIPVRVADLPITTTTYTTPSTLKVEDLDQRVRRPMEVLRQSQLPPACGFAAYFNNRVYAFGEITHKPTSDELIAGGSMAITNGLTTATINSGYTAHDGLIGKELYLNKAGTGWFCIDVSSQTIYLRHPSDEKNALGIQETTGTYQDWAFSGRPSRVYRSAYFSGEAGGQITFSPETFPVLQYLESELDIDDNDNPVGAIQARDVLFLGKKNKWFYLQGGAGTDDDPSGAGFPVVVPVSRGSGLLAPNTLCTDRFDNVYYLSEQGPHMLTQSGVQKVGTMAGCAFLFQQYFEVRGADAAVGAWYPKYDWFVVAGLDRKDEGGGTSGFIFDSKTGGIFPFSFPRRITALLAAPTDDGDGQLLFGDEVGNVGVLFQKDTYSDDVNYLSSSPYANEVLPTCYVTSGVVTNGSQLTVVTVAPSVKVTPNTTAITWTVAVDAEPQSGDVKTFATTVSCSHKTDDSRPWYPMERWQTQSARLKASFTPTRSTRVQIASLPFTIEEPKSSQTQTESA